VHNPDHNAQQETDLHITSFCLGTTTVNTPAAAIIRQDDTILIMHKTLTMFFFTAGNISSARCSSIVGTLV
jgi:hypothetical protein